MQVNWPARATTRKRRVGMFRHQVRIGAREGFEDARGVELEAADEIVGEDAELPLSTTSMANAPFELDEGPFLGATATDEGMQGRQTVSRVRRRNRYLTVSPVIAHAGQGLQHRSDTHQRPYVDPRSVHGSTKRLRRCLRQLLPSCSSGSLPGSMPTALGHRCHVQDAGHGRLGLAMNRRVARNSSASDATKSNGEGVPESARW